MGDVELTFTSLVNGLRGRAAPPHREPFDDRLPGLLDLIRAGEAGVAVEDLCSNLYEFEVSVTEREQGWLSRRTALCRRVVAPNPRP